MTNVSGVNDLRISKKTTYRFNLISLSVTASAPETAAMFRPSSAPSSISSLTVVALALALNGCGGPPPRSAERIKSPSASPIDALALLESRELGTPGELPPWIAHVKSVDLDQDGLTDIVFCEAQFNEIRWIRQTAPGQFAPEALLASDLRGPVHAEAADMDQDGDLDLLISSMSVVFPNNDRVGTAFLLENDGQQNFTPRILIENTTRIVDMRPADFDGDGDLDLALAQFGYDQGEVSWLENKSRTDWNFERHVLLDLSGAVNVVVADFNGDRRPDIVALLSQQWEEVYYFQNSGSGTFTRQRIWGSTNEDYGSSGISVSDLNRDGRPDVIYTNGDGFGPAATPGPRPWHGVQWFENTGNGGFRYHRIGPLPGAYSPVGVDLDQDGAMDVVAAAAYSDWNSKNRNVVSLMWFRNDGNMNFQPHMLTRTPKDLITLDVGDFDGTGRPSLISGGFYIYPPFDAMSRVMLWTPRSQP